MSLLTYFRKRFASKVVKDLRIQVIDKLREVSEPRFAAWHVWWYPNDTTPIRAPLWYKLTEGELNDILQILERIIDYRSLVTTSYVNVGDIVHLGPDGVVSPLEDTNEWTIADNENITLELLENLTKEFKAYRQGWVTLNGLEQRYRDFLKTTPFEAVLINLYAFCRLDNKTQSKYFTQVSELQKGLSFVSDNDKLSQVEYFLFPEMLIKSSGLTIADGDGISVFYLSAERDRSSIRSRKLTDFSVVSKETVKDYLTAMEMVPRTLWTESLKRIVRSLTV